jgi:hypothetical protein
MEVGIETEDFANIFGLLVLIDINVNCIAFPST